MIPLAVVASAVTIEERTVELRFALPEDAALALLDPSRGAIEVRQTSAERLEYVVGESDRFLAWPSESSGGWCKAWLGEAELGIRVVETGCAVVLPPAPTGSLLRLEWGWTEPLRFSGEVTLAEPWPIGRARVSIDGGAAVVVGDGLGGLVHEDSGAFVYERSGAALDRVSEGDLAVHLPPGVVWRVASLAGVDVLPGRDAVLAELAYGAIAASMPEPGLPLEFRGRKGEAELVPEILAWVSGHLQPALPPGVHPLEPRRLIDVKQSGWGTPWEQALVLTRLLVQARIDAVPMPVRPAASGAADPDTPVGYTAAVVRVDLDGRELWLDPSCGHCAAGELAPELWGGQVLLGSLERLPPPPESRFVRAVDEQGQLHVEVEGPAALQLRGLLFEQRLEDRASWLAHQLGGPGAKLVAVEGVGTNGAQIRAVLQVVDGPPPLSGSGPAEIAALGLAVPTPGTWLDVRPAPADQIVEPMNSGTVMTEPGASELRPRVTWTRSLERGTLVESLTISVPVAAWEVLQVLDGAAAM